MAIAVRMKHYEQKQYSSKKSNKSYFGSVVSNDAVFSARLCRSAFFRRASRAKSAILSGIMRDVAGCTWTAETQISHTTLLYDITGKMNGCVYEYANGEKPAEFP